MAALTIKCRSVSKTKAAMGFAGGRSLAVDRPDGKAGGQGLGFNGGDAAGVGMAGRLSSTGPRAVRKAESPGKPSPAGALSKIGAVERTRTSTRLRTTTSR